MSLKYFSLFLSYKDMFYILIYQKVLKFLILFSIYRPLKFRFFPKWIFYSRLFFYKDRNKIQIKKIVRKNPTIFILSSTCQAIIWIVQRTTYFSHLFFDSLFRLFLNGKLNSIVCRFVS